MTENSVPLQKELVSLNIAQGVNERDRPETAEPTSTFSRFENLYQDETGAYTKRYGTSALGATLTSPTKLLRLRDGLGAVANDARLYHYQESLGAWLDKGYVPPFTTTADFVVSSGFTNVPTVVEVASCTNFHAIQLDSGGGAYFIVIYDRNSGLVVAKYNQTTALGWTRNAKMVFVDDRYLHIYSFKTAVGLHGLVLDTHAAMPAASALTPTVLDAAGATGVFDIARHTGRSIVLYVSTATKYILAMNNAQAFIESASLAGATAISNSGTKLWYMTASNIGAKDPAVLATDLVASADVGLGGAIPDYMCATASNRVYGIKQTAALTFGGTTIKSLQVYTTAANGTTLTATSKVDGWACASQPFADATSGRAFVHVTKDAGLTITPNVVIEITDDSYTLNSYNSQTYYSTRIACSLDPHLAVANSNVLRYLSPEGTHFHPLVPVQTVARGYGFAVFDMKIFGNAEMAVDRFGPTNHMSGGCHSAYAGDRITESGYVDIPLVNLASGGTGITGSFGYIAVYKDVDEAGSVSWSRCSSVMPITVSNKTITCTVLPCNVTNRDLVSVPSISVPYIVGNQVVELYRTTSGGTQYYLVASNQSGTPYGSLLTQALALNSSRFYAVADSMTDANLILQPTLFRQPGTPNAAVDRYPPPCGNVLCQHKDRVFTIDPYGQRVYYSSFFVDGENAWFNPAFSFFIHGASGPITALASMDGRLFVFKRNGIFVVDGDGPPEGGPSGNEYSPPQRLATEFGCLDHRSLAVTTEGIIYKSDRGVELLTRSLQVKWLGDKVQTTVDSYPKVCGVAIDSFGRYHLALGASDTGTATQTGVSGVRVVYDPTCSCWTIQHHTNHSGTYDRCLQDITRADLYGFGETVCFADPAGYVVREDSASGLDHATYWVPWTIETAWVKTGQQNRARFSKAMLLAKRLSNHAVSISAAYNYIDSYTQVGRFEPDEINEASLEHLMENLECPEGISVRLLFQDSAPTDTTTFPVGTGRGCDVLGISVEIAQKTGAPKLPDGQKV